MAQGITHEPRLAGVLRPLSAPESTGGGENPHLRPIWRCRCGWWQHRNGDPWAPLCPHCIAAAHEAIRPDPLPLAWGLAVDAELWGD